MFTRYFRSPLPRNAGNFPRGGKDPKHVFLPTHLAYLQLYNICNYCIYLKRSKIFTCVEESNHLRKVPINTHLRGNHRDYSFMAYIFTHSKTNYVHYSFKKDINTNIILFYFCVKLFALSSSPNVSSLESSS